MRTTSYEISKKLWEIGFEAKFDDRFVHPIKPEEIQGDPAKYGFRYPAYDLDTILDALPKHIPCKRGKKECEYDLDMSWGHGLLSIQYNLYDEVSGDIIDSFQMIESGQDESTADTATRLLLELVEAGIVKFNN